MVTIWQNTDTNEVVTDPTKITTDQLNAFTTRNFLVKERTHAEMPAVDCWQWAEKHGFFGMTKEGFISAEMEQISLTDIYLVVRYESLD